MKLKTWRKESHTHSPPPNPRKEIVQWKMIMVQRKISLAYLPLNIDQCYFCELKPLICHTLTQQEEVRKLTITKPTTITKEKVWNMMINSIRTCELSKSLSQVEWWNMLVSKENLLFVPHWYLFLTSNKEEWIQWAAGILPEKNDFNFWLVHFSLTKLTTKE